MHKKINIHISFFQLSQIFKSLESLTELTNIFDLNDELIHALDEKVSKAVNTRSCRSSPFLPQKHGPHYGSHRILIESCGPLSFGLHRDEIEGRRVLSWRVQKRYNLVKGYPLVAIRRHRWTPVLPIQIKCKYMCYNFW